MGTLTYFRQGRGPEAALRGGYGRWGEQVSVPSGSSECDIDTRLE